MLNEFKEFIDNQLAALKTTERGVQFLINEFNSLNELRKSLTEQIGLYTPAEIRAQAIRDIKQEAQDILVTNALNAVRETVEFDLAVFKVGLLRAIRDERTIVFRGTKVSINLSTTAGNLKQYAEAVKKARQSLGIGPYRKTPLPPELAAHMWEEKYYGVARENRKLPRKGKRKPREAQYRAKYFRTIHLRVSFFGKALAPWWELVDSGNIGVKLDSDWGGTPYPKYTGTHFVEKSRAAIEGLLKERIASIKANVTKLKEILETIRQKQAYVSALLKKLGEIKDIQRQTRIEEQLRKQLNDRYPLADPKRVEELIFKLLNDIPITTEKVELTARGGPRIRVRTQTLRKIAAGYR